MSETLEQRLRRLAKEDDATLCQVYPGDVVELLDERDKLSITISTRIEQMEDVKMKLNLSEAIEILQKEIVWCLDHPDKELNNDQQMGFMNGLRQAQTLLRKAEAVVSGNTQETKHNEVIQDLIYAVKIWRSRMPADIKGYILPRDVIDVIRAIDEYDENVGKYI